MQEQEKPSATAVEAPDFMDLVPASVALALRFIASMGIDLIFVLLMAACLLVTLWTNGASLKLAQASVLYPIGMMVGLLLTRSLLWQYRHWRGRPEGLALKTVFLQTLRDWIPFILIDFIYENLHDLSRFFHSHDVAGIMMRWDIRLIGVEPTLWIQKFFHPLLTDYMAFVYALYFVFPLVIMYFLSYRNRRSELREVIFALSLTFLLGFLGYVLFPCSPPRYYLEGQFVPEHLSGYFIYNRLQERWDSLSAIRAGAFPSLHVGISSIALIYAYRLRGISRFDRILFWIYVPLIVSLWASTVYLRHHWVTDIIAGWIIALASCIVAPIIANGWEDLRVRYGLHFN